MAETTNQEPQKKNNKIGLIIGFFAILVGTNGFQIWKNMSDTKTLTTEKDAVIKAKVQDNTKLIASLDSVGTIINTQIAEIEKLGGNADSLKTIVAQLEADKASLRRQVSSVVVLKRSIEEYKEIIAQKDTEIDQIKAEREKLFEENKGLKDEKVKMIDSLAAIVNIKQQLDKQVAVAAILRAEKIQISAIDKKGKEIVGEEIKAKKIDKLKVSFVLGDNKVAKIETKTVYIRLQGPDGATIYNESTGGGTVTMDGKEITYTAKQDVLFDNNKPALTFIYSKGNPFAIGRNSVEVYCEDTKIGEGSFIVKK